MNKFAASRYIVYCILYIVYCTLYIVHCIFYIVYCILYIVYCILYIVYCILQDKADPKADYPACCPVYDCEEGTEIKYVTPPKAKVGNILLPSKHGFKQIKIRKVNKCKLLLKEKE